MDVAVNSRLVIPDAEIEMKFSVSGGPGGQHANKANTRVELVWEIAESAVLTAGQREQLVGKLGPRLRVVVDDERSQVRNREIAHSRLADRVRAGLVRDKPRRATKPSRGAKRRRMDTKSKRGQLKKQRRRPNRDD